MISKEMFRCNGPGSRDPEKFPIGKRRHVAECVLSYGELILASIVDLDRRPTKLRKEFAGSGQY
jgi:hypothetical protein